jgi:hypothetical protein
VEVLGDLAEVAEEEVFKQMVKQEDREVLAVVEVAAGSVIQ